MNNRWPPPYMLKKHPRARNVRLKASIQYGLELIVPGNFNVALIPRLLDQNRSWIEKRLGELQVRGLTATVDSLPEKLDFLAVNSCWTVYYVASDRKLQLITGPAQEIRILGNIEDKNACRQLLLAWIKKQAKLYLLAQLERCSLKTGLSYKRASIRDQNSRWGSCSSKKSINLNYKLLFLTPSLMAHVMIHELCHTVHLNHSTHFWQLVAAYDPQWREHRQALRKAAAFIPSWLVARRANHSP
jgi:predicted metal-dependent hydrolase